MWVSVGEGGGGCNRCGGFQLGKFMVMRCSSIYVRLVWEVLNKWGGRAFNMCVRKAHLPSRGAPP